MFMVWRNGQLANNSKYNSYFMQNPTKYFVRRIFCCIFVQNKNNLMTIDELKKEISLVEKPKNWRDGQFVFNYIDEVYGVARIAQYHYNVDCFHNDNKIDDFLDVCCKLINENLEHINNNLND